jgi:hypothetical protein
MVTFLTIGFAVSAILMMMFVLWLHLVCFQLRVILSISFLSLWIECFWYSGTAYAT